ncbi:MAG: MFS transporter [Acidimicrobiia bacterium]
MTAGVAGRSSLFESRDFRRLWLGQTVSLLGTQVTFIALPLTAIEVLHAPLREIGILAALQFLPYVVFGLPTGALVDRLQRRTVMLVTNVMLAASLAAVPVASAAGLLSMPLLYVVAFAAGSLTMTFELAYTSYLPILVRRDLLLAANSRLEVSRAMAQISGATVGGVLIALVSAPFAIAVDAASYLAAALMIATMRHREEPRQREAASRLWTEISSGVRFVVGHNLIRTIALVAALDNLLLSAQGALFIPYLARNLDLDPTLIGVAVAAGSLGGLAGAVGLPRLARRWGAWRSIVAAQMAMLIAILLLPLASAVAAAALLFVVVSGLGFGVSRVVLMVSMGTLRQQLTPDDLQGRVAAAVRLIGVGTIPVGAALGGFSGEWIGLPATFVACGVGFLLPLGLVLNARSLTGEPAPAL